MNPHIFSVSMTMQSFASQRMHCSPGTGMGTRRGQHHPWSRQLCDHKNFQNDGWEADRST